MTGSVSRATFVGVAVVAANTLFAAGADGTIKRLSQNTDMAQVLLLSSVIAVVLSLMLRPSGPWTAAFRTTMPGAMAVRSVATVVSVSAYFFAFKLLGLAEVFPFIAMAPVFAGLMSGPVLNEPIRSAAWVAILGGVAGIMVVGPGGAAGWSTGHLFAFVASLSGTVSIVMARFIGRREKASLALVLWPNVAIIAIMLPVIPFVWRAASLQDYMLIGLYGGLTFMSRLLLVHALRLLPAHTTSALLNLHFLWMVIIGYLAFGEMPTPPIMVGAGIVISASLYLILDQCRPRMALAAPT